MVPGTPQPIDRLALDAGDLHRQHPPRWGHPNKALVYDIACSSGYPFVGRLDYTRWAVQPLPRELVSLALTDVRAGPFAYDGPSRAGVVNWHVNFADEALFVAYGSALLAQDEWQVAEHPSLGCLREALLAQGFEAVTVDALGYPTPVTVTGVQRRCAIETRLGVVADCPAGLYGNAFARATAAQVRAATRALAPPTTSNILAMAALAGGQGRYNREEMFYLLNVAYGGFAAARCESMCLGGAQARTLIHTGFWGCGAFGGNHRLMVMLQWLAASLADVGLVFWAFDSTGETLAMHALRNARAWAESSRSVASWMARLLDLGFEWGVSDRN